MIAHDLIHDTVSGLVFVLYVLTYRFPHMHTCTQRYPMSMIHIYYESKQKVLSLFLIRRSSEDTLLLTVLWAFLSWSQDGHCNVTHQAHTPVRMQEGAGMTNRILLHLLGQICVTWSSLAGKRPGRRDWEWAWVNTSTLSASLCSQANLYSFMVFFMVL